MGEVTGQQPLPGHCYLRSWLRVYCWGSVFVCFVVDMFPLERERESLTVCLSLAVLELRVRTTTPYTTVVFYWRLFSASFADGLIVASGVTCRII